MNGDKYTFTVKKRHMYFIIIAIAFFVGGYLVNSLIGHKPTITSHVIGTSPETEASIESFSDEEIYKLFICACCGRTIDARCCGMAKDMINHIDSLVDAGLSKTDVIIATVKKYGLSSLVESKQAEIKSELLRRAPADRPKISIEPASYDFGDVSQAKGTVSTFFIVKNDGKTDLIINEISTSCGCTSASLDGSPFFGMRGMEPDASPPGWTYKIPPGGTAELEVKYDPNVHKDFRGAATRIVYISSNDPVDFQKELRIELNQVD